MITLSAPVKYLVMSSLLAMLLGGCLHDDGDESNDDATAGIGLEQILAGMHFAHPLLFLQHPGDDNIFYVVQQNGVIWRADLAAGTRSELVKLADHYSLTDCGECGLLGMAFDPGFASNGFIYLSFTEGPDNDHMTSRVARFRSANNGQSLAMSGAAPERTEVFSVAQPFTNHNGGNIAFGPDGLLYLGLGDGGSGNDPHQNGQNINTVLGKMLRLNPDGSAAAGNLIAAQGGDARIFAFGLRNPWRWSFDRETGDLWVGDVGQNTFEEIDLVVNGGNYGWRCREGLQATSGIGACTLTGGPAIDPVTVIGRDEGQSITGGYVYRGSALADLRGVYVFGDYASGRIWGLSRRGGDYERAELLKSGLNISSFGEDRNGEIYVIDHTGGGIYRIVGGNG
ncbi:MAG TPA: PQQ-dependent sugar dehydrogenase [Gammaproteobacteria bacterium]|nr:PQQ-dependent sugar dehydrogenase [Gammaproteobacteria bacterium]